MKTYILTLFVALTFISCDSILNQELVGSRTDQDYWQTEADLRDAIAGVYQPWATRALGMNDLFFDNQSDDHWRAGDHAEDEEIETYNTDPSNSKIRDTYQFKYEVISRANGVIINGPKVKAKGAIGDELYNSIMGQAYFLRAYAYYRLFLIHGQVPIIKEENVLNNLYNVPKCESSTVLAEFILEDLNTAIQLLPLRNISGSVGKGAAWAVMTSIYMHLAKDYADSQQLNKAIQAGKNVIDNYKLADDYVSLFRNGNENLEENLFLMMNDMSWIDQELLSKHRGPRPWGMYGFNEPHLDLLNEFEEGDKRKSITIVSNGESVSQAGAMVVHIPGLSETGHSYFKYMDWVTPETFNHGLNIPFLRAADTYLLVAEAKIRLNGPGAGDTEINAVRKRAGLNPVSNATIQDLIHETRTELAGENFRYQNLLRWDKAGIYDLQTFLVQASKMMPADAGRMKWVRPKNYYQPLPQIEIDNADGVLIQNPLWTN
jgi:hypothetical protein